MLFLILLTFNLSHCGQKMYLLIKPFSKITDAAEYVDY